MRNLTFASSLLAASILSAQAPEAPPYNWAQLQGGMIFQDNASCVKNAPALGVGAGTWFNPNWGAEATLLFSRLESTSNLWKANETHLDVSGLYRPWTGSQRWIPFLRAGLGASNLQNPLSLSGSATTRLNLMVGVGTQVVAGPRSICTAELRAMTIESSTQRQEIQVLVGYGFRWGKTSAPAPQAVPPPPPPAPVIAPAPVVVPVPAPEPPPAPVVVAPEPPKKIVLDEAQLHFATNQATLSPADQNVVRKVAASLKEFTGAYTLVVTGYTDASGALKHNEALSKQRADTVAGILAEEGIPAANISTVGRGPANPIGDNQTKEGRSKNRRVEIDVNTSSAVEKTKTDTALVDGPAPAKAPKAPKKGHTKR